MSDRAVAIYLVLCLVQLPLYFVLGRTPLSFDFKVAALERKLMDYSSTEEERDRLFEEFEELEAELRRDSIDDSRIFRLWLSRAVLSWRTPDTERTEELFKKTLQGFLQTHGEDSYYAAGVRARYGEFLLSQRRHNEAEPLLRRARLGLHQTLGPSDPFTIRIAIREISNLETLGRDKPAGELAAKYAPLLLATAGTFEEALLFQAGQAFDRLTRRGELYRPAARLGWGEALEVARRQGRGVEEAKRTEGP